MSDLMIAIAISMAVWLVYKYMHNRTEKIKGAMEAIDFEEAVKIAKIVSENSREVQSLLAQLETLPPIKRIPEGRYQSNNDRQYYARLNERNAIITKIVSCNDFTSFQNVQESCRPEFERQREEVSEGTDTTWDNPRIANGISLLAYFLIIPACYMLWQIGTIIYNLPWGDSIYWFPVILMGISMVIGFVGLWMAMYNQFGYVIAFIGAALFFGIRECSTGEEACVIGKLGSVLGGVAPTSLVFITFGVAGLLLVLVFLGIGANHEPVRCSTKNQGRKLPREYDADVITSTLAGDTITVVVTEYETPAKPPYSRGNWTDPNHLISPFFQNELIHLAKPGKVIEVNGEVTVISFQNEAMAKKVFEKLSPKIAAANTKIRRQASKAPWVDPDETLTIGLNDHY